MFILEKLENFSRISLITYGLENKEILDIYICFVCQKGRTCLKSNEVDQLEIGSACHGHPVASRIEA